MVSLSFPFYFHQNSASRSSNIPNPPFFSSSTVAFAGFAAGIKFFLAIPSNSNANQQFPYRNSSKSSDSHFASLSLNQSSTTEIESKTGVIFPNFVDDSRRLLGIGLRRKSLFGLKNIDVYAFGVYAEVNDIKKLAEKYGVLSESELRGSKQFFADVLDQDLRMTVKLQIVYGRLKIGSVRSAFEESVGDRLKKFSGSENKELLKRFTSLFRDEYKLPRGSVIDLSREQGYILKTRIDGEEVGSIQSKLLCQSILDLYIGDDPFDKKAKEDIVVGLNSLLQN